MPIHAYLLIAAALLAVLATIILEALDWSITFAMLLVIAGITALLGLVEYAR